MANTFCIDQFVKGRDKFDRVLVDLAAIVRTAGKRKRNGLIWHNEGETHNSIGIYFKNGRWHIIQRSGKNVFVDINETSSKMQFDNRVKESLVKDAARVNANKAEEESQQPAQTKSRSAFEQKKSTWTIKQASDMVFTFGDTTHDVLGYSDWRKWPEGFTEKHDIRFNTCPQKAFNLALQEGTAVLRFYDQDGNVCFMQRMCDAEERNTEYYSKRKYLNLSQDICSGRKGLMFEQNRRKGANQLLIVEGAMDLYRAVDMTTDNVDVAFLGGHSISEEVFEDLVRYIIENNTEHVWFYLENDVTDARSVRRRLGAVLDEVYNKIGVAPGLSFVRLENKRNIIASKGEDYVPVNTDFDDCVTSIISQDYNGDDFDFVRVDYVYVKDEDGIYHKDGGINGFAARVKNPYALHISGSTGDGKSTSTRALMKAVSESTNNNYRMLFSCFNTAEVAEGVKNVPLALAMSSITPFGQGTDIQNEFEEAKAALEAKGCTNADKSKLFRLYEERFESFLANYNGAIVATHGYFHKLVFKYDWTPSLAVIDEEFNEYNPWYNSNGYGLHIFLNDNMLVAYSRDSLLERLYAKKTILCYLDGTGRYKLDRRYGNYFQGGSWRCGVARALSRANILPDELRPFEGDKKFDLTPKTHKRVHCNIHLIDGVTNTRSKLGNESDGAGNKLVDMILYSTDVKKHKKSLLMFVYKECICALYKAVRAYEKKHGVELPISLWYCMKECTIDSASKFEEYQEQDVDMQRIEQQALMARIKELQQENDEEELEKVQELLEKTMGVNDKLYQERKQMYLDMDDEHAEAIGAFFREFGDICIATWNHGRGSNKFREYDNVIMIGGFRSYIGDSQTECEEAWQSQMRCQARIGEYALINWWCSDFSMENCERLFKEWDNQQRISPTTYKELKRLEALRPDMDGIKDAIREYECSTPCNYYFHFHSPDFGTIKLCTGWDELKKERESMNAETARIFRKYHLYSFQEEMQYFQLYPNDRPIEQKQTRASRYTITSIENEVLLYNQAETNDKKRARIRLRLIDKVNRRYNKRFKDWKHCKAYLITMGMQFDRRVNASGYIIGDANDANNLDTPF